MQNRLRRTCPVEGATSERGTVVRTIKRLVARLSGRAALALAMDPVPHAQAFAGQGGFHAVSRLLATCEGEAAAALLRQYGASVGARPMIFEVTVLNAADGFQHLTMADHCHVGHGAVLDLTDTIRLDARCTVSLRAMLLTHFDAGSSQAPAIIAGKRRAPIVVGHDAYIGAGAIVLPGVTIGAEAIVGAGAVVTKSVPAGVAVAGIPARPLNR